METLPIAQPINNPILNTASGNSSSSQKKIFLAVGLILLLVIITGGILYWKINSGSSVIPVQVSVKTDYGNNLTPTPLISPALPTGNANQSLDTDLSNLDQQLGTLSKDQTQIDAGINETLPNLTL